MERTKIIKKLLEKSTTVVVLLLLLAFSVTATTIVLVQADAGGTGKYLTIEVVGGGSVTALKVKSGQEWTFGNLPEQSVTEKVGAGTIELTANAAGDWPFSRWENIEGETISKSEIIYYKTEKYGYLKAVFGFTITPIVTGNGIIDPADPITVQAGAEPTFTFTPYDDPETPEIDNHISAIKVNGITEGIFSTEYTFPPVDADQTIEVVFDPEGQTTIPDMQPGETGTFFAATSASVTFNGQTNGGILLGGEVYTFGLGAWQLTPTFIVINEAEVVFTYDDTVLPSGFDEMTLVLIKGDTYEAIRSDLDGDADVDGQDTSTIANANKAYEQDSIYDPIFDIDDDGDIDEHDIHIVNVNKGAVLEIVTCVIDPVANTMTFSTGTFSYFKASRFR